MIWDRVEELHFQLLLAGQLVCIFDFFYSYIIGYQDGVPDLPTESLDIVSLHNVTQWDLLVAS